MAHLDDDRIEALGIRRIEAGAPIHPRQRSGSAYHDYLVRFRAGGSRRIMERIAPATDEAHATRTVRRWMIDAGFRNDDIETIDAKPYQKEVR